MTFDFLIVLAMVALATGYLARRFLAGWLARRAESQACGGCAGGCETETAGGISGPMAV